MIAIDAGMALGDADPIGSKVADALRVYIDDFTVRRVVVDHVDRAGSGDGEYIYGRGALQNDVQRCESAGGGEGNLRVIAIGNSDRRNAVDKSGNRVGWSGCKHKGPAGIADVERADL